MPENPADKSKELRTLSIEDRQALGSAIMEGLISPQGLVFNRLATEGGDYNQGNGGYTQSGGGNHNQGGGDYSQSASVTDRFNRVDILDVTNVAEIIRTPGRM